MTVITHNEWTEHEVLKLQAASELWSKKGGQLTFKKSDTHSAGCYEMYIRHWNHKIREVWIIAIHKIFAGPGFFKHKSIWVAELSIMNADAEVDNYGCVEVDGPFSALDIGTRRLSDKFKSNSRIENYYF